MTAVIAETFDDGPRAEADRAAEPLDWAALGAGPEALAELRAACEGPTVEVRTFEPFQGDNASPTAVWAVVDRDTARRLVEPAPIIDPALADRDESTSE